MMIISHRGNLNGPNPQRENMEDYIDEALNAGFQCEVDLWQEKNKLYLGHDEPMYEVEYDFLASRGVHLIVHAKNFGALSYLYMTNLNYFWHQTDEYTLTSRRWIWMYSGNRTFNSYSIMACPEDAGFYNRDDLPDIGGVCTDFPYNWTEKK